MKPRGNVSSPFFPLSGSIFGFCTSITFLSRQSALRFPRGRASLEVFQQRSGAASFCATADRNLRCASFSGSASAEYRVGRRRRGRRREQKDGKQKDGWSAVIVGNSITLCPTATISTVRASSGSLPRPERPLTRFRASLHLSV